MMNGETVIPSEKWLEGAQAMIVSNGSATGAGSLGGTLMTTAGGSFSGGSTSGTVWYYPPYNIALREPRPIRLLLSEVERLRKAAKADEKLKAILQKFTGQIEIVVDFD